MTLGIGILLLLASVAGFVALSRQLNQTQHKGLLVTAMALLGILILLLLMYTALAALLLWAV